MPYTKTIPSIPSLLLPRFLFCFVFFSTLCLHHSEYSLHVLSPPWIPDVSGVLQFLSWDERLQRASFRLPPLGWLQQRKQVRARGCGLWIVSEQLPSSVVCSHPTEILFTVNKAFSWMGFLWINIMNNVHYVSHVRLRQSVYTRYKHVLYLTAFLKCWHFEIRVHYIPEGPIVLSGSYSCCPRQR